MGTDYNLLEYPTFDEWLAGRDRGLGSTDAPTLLGLTPWKSPLALYHEKRVGLGLSDLDLKRGPKYAELAKWGKDCEDLVAARYQIATGRPIIKPPAHTVAEHKTIPWMRASVDRYATVVNTTPVPVPANSWPIVAAEKWDSETIVVELKWAHFMSKSKWLDTDSGFEEPPLEYVVQVQHQLAVTGKPWASIAVVIGGVMFKYADIKRDDEFIGNLIVKEEQFWRDVHAGNEPPADGHADTTALLKQMYPSSVAGKAIELPPAAIEWHETLTSIKAQIKLLEADETRIANLVKQAMGDAELGTLRNGKGFRWKSSPRKAYTVAATTQRPLTLIGD